MKHYTTILLLSLLLPFLACEEVGPTIDLTPPDLSLIDTSYVASTIQSPQARVVVLEEFTGVACVNCPKGHIKSEEIVKAHPDQVISLAIHAGDLAHPVDGSQDDYALETGQELYESFSVAGLPSAMINRKQFGEESNFILFINAPWESYVEEEMATSPKVNLKAEATYEAADSSLSVIVTTHYTESVNWNNYLSVAILEDNIIDAQKLPDDSIDPTYEHDHVLRTFLTPSNGTLLVGLDTEKQAGLEVQKGFKLKPVPSNWQRNNLQIVAYVHGRGETKAILQGTKTDIQE